MTSRSRSRHVVLALSRVLADLIVGRPVVVIVVVLAVTGLFGGLGGKAVTVDAGAVENGTTQVLEEFDARFSGQQAVLQVVVTADRDVRNTAALRTSIAIREEIHASQAAETLADPDGHPPVVGFLDGAETAVETAAVDLAALADTDVVDLHEAAREQVPLPMQRLLDGLVANDDQPTSGLILVFQDTVGLDDNAIVAQQRELAEVVRGVRRRTA